jgi:hypothetical protein
MKIKQLLIATILLLSSGAYGQSDGIVIQNGWITGNDFVGSLETQKSFYIMGLIDGISLSPFFDATQGKVQAFRSCTVDMTNTQLVAILDLYLSRNPAEWHNNMHIIFFRSVVVETCGL